MVTITLYRVWSEVPPYEDAPTLEGTFTEWNVPGTQKGAVQCRDRVQDHYYRQGMNALVVIQEVRADMPERIVPAEQEKGRE